ncbi:fatty acid desaturase family protein [Sorangium cellulosum]|nr:fatty acid desaturase family protein [Sorangium cellulosum]
MMEASLDRNRMISRRRLAELSRRDTARVLRAFAFDYAVIVAAVVISERFWSLPLYLAAVVTIAARQVGMFSVALHDGAHGLLTRDRARNDRLARRLLVPSIVFDLLEYRPMHFDHHRRVNAPDDPDLEEFLDWYAVPPWRRALRLAGALVGLRLLVPLCRLVIRGNWRQRALAIAIPGALVAGVLLPVWPLRIVALYWMVPLATWGMFINLLRAVAEHYPPGTANRPSDAPLVMLTRDVVPSLFDSAFVVTRNANYHLSHHLFPSVPFFRLPELHRELARSEPFQRHAHVTRGYHRALLEVVFDRAPAAALQRGAAP